MISIENLSFAYSGSSVPALKNISMEIQDGDFVVMGEMEFEYER